MNNLRKKYILFEKDGDMSIDLFGQHQSCLINKLSCKKLYLFSMSANAMFKKSFSRHIELYLYNAKLNQASRKPQNSPLVTVTSSFHGQ